MHVCVGFYDVGIVGEAFTYAVLPQQEEFIGVGVVVTVPFGATQKEGIVFAINEDNQSENIRTVISVRQHKYTSLMPKVYFETMIWIAKYYRSPLHKVLRLFLPEKIWTEKFDAERFVVVQIPQNIPKIPSNGTKIKEIYAAIEEKVDVWNVFSKSYLRKLEEKKYLSLSYGAYVPVATGSTYEADSTGIPELTVEQTKIYEEIMSDPKKTFLLFGVTGSGKTRIYLEIAKTMFAQGKQTLFLVPEIALTPQLLAYFGKYFGDKMSVLHSHLSTGEKQQEWVRIISGQSQVIVGSRSALFAPILNPGAIIIDEEHEWTYKNEQNPRYHARDVAVYMQKTMSLLLLLGSATPSIESMYNAREGKYKLISLPEKIYEQRKRK